MTYNEIIALALALTHTKAGQVSAGNLKTFFNIKRKELGNAIVKDVDENYFMQIWTRDAIANQNNGEYPYPEADSDSAGMLKLLKLSIKARYTDIYYSDKMTEVDIKALPHDWGWYLENQPKEVPIYYIGDESVFIAPQFVAADLPASPSGNAQIKMYGVAKMTDLDVGATAAAILIPDDSHHRIAIGMKELILTSRGKKSEANLAKQEFELEKSIMIDELTNRDNSGMTAKVPNDLQLGYGN